MKKLFLFVLILVLALIPIGNMNTATAYAAIEKYELNSENIYMLSIGNKLTLYIDTNKKVTWSSSDKDIATVSKNGTITGKSEGSTIITAKVGSKKYKCELEVKDFSDWVMFKTDMYEVIEEAVQIGEALRYEDDYYIVSPEYYNDVLDPLLDELKEKSERESPLDGIKKKSLLTPDAEFIIKDYVDEEEKAEIDELKRKLEAIMSGDNK